MWGCRFFGDVYFFQENLKIWIFMWNSLGRHMQEPIIMWIYHVYWIYLCKSICEFQCNRTLWEAHLDIPWRELCGYSMYCTRFWILLLIIQWGFIFCILHERNIPMWLKKMWNKAAIWWFSNVGSGNQLTLLHLRDMGGNPSIFLNMQWQKQLALWWGPRFSDQGRMQ